MGSRPFPGILCALCHKSVDLRSEPCTDENGRVIHWDCYVNRLEFESPKQNAEVA
jgi:hypothetical protein